jgi:hypothetical protein
MALEVLNKQTRGVPENEDSLASDYLRYPYTQHTLVSLFTLMLFFS